LLGDVGGKSGIRLPGDEVGKDCLSFEAVAAESGGVVDLAAAGTFCGTVLSTWRLL
jgi:hypothetical protein